MITTGNLVITIQGRELMAKLIAGTSTAAFTKICTSDYDYSGKDLEVITELQEIKQEVLISKVSKLNASQVEVLAAIDNKNLESGYYVKCLGLYVRDSDGNEILYGIYIENEHPDYMPAYAGRTVSGITYRLNTKVDNSEQVTVEVNPAATPTIAQVEEITESVREITAKMEDKANKSISRLVILSAAAWTGEAVPYSYTVTLEEATETNNIEINAPLHPTPEQYEQLTGAGIFGGTQTEGSITLSAYGDKPTIDLPVIILIRGD